MEFELLMAPRLSGSHVYGFMLAIRLLSCLVLVWVSITCTYVLLNAEVYRWQWQSCVCCGATAVCGLLYTIHYFLNSSQMSGFLQTVYYFEKPLNFCIPVFLVLCSCSYFFSVRVGVFAPPWSSHLGSGLLSVRPCSVVVCVRLCLRSRARAAPPLLAVRSACRRSAGFGAVVLLWVGR